MFWNISRIYIFFLTYKTSGAICYIISLSFFSNIFFWWKNYFFSVTFIYKRLQFCNSLQRFFLFLYNLTRLLQYIETIFYLFLLTGIFLLFFSVLSNQENLAMIHHDWDLFYDIYSTATEHNQRQTQYFHQLQIILISISEWIKKFIYNFIWFSTNQDLYLITFWMHYMLFIITYRSNKVICYC